MYNFEKNSRIILLCFEKIKYRSCSYETEISFEKASIIDLCDVQCIFTKGNDFRQNAISFKANLRR